MIPCTTITSESKSSKSKEIIIDKKLEEFHEFQILALSNELEFVKKELEEKCLVLENQIEEIFLMKEELEIYQSEG